MTRRNFLQGLLAAPLLALLPRRGLAARLEPVAPAAGPSMKFELLEDATIEKFQVEDAFRRDLADQLGVPRHKLARDSAQDTRAGIKIAEDTFRYMREAVRA